MSAETASPSSPNQNPNKATTTQLKLIAEVDRLLDSEGMPCWVFGGWAVDFLVGYITRDHNDVDLVIRLEHAEHAKRLLAGHGYELIDHRAEDLIFRKEGQKVELYFVTTDVRGQTITPGQWAYWPWPKGSFGDARGRIGAVSCRVVNPTTQLDLKESYFRQVGTPLRAKDRADIEALRSVLGCSERIQETPPTA